MGDRLKGKVAIVTGAGRGIGRGEALALAAEGAKVVVNDLGCELDGTGTSTAPADEVVAEIKAKGGETVANYDSVATPEGASNIIKTAVDTFGRLDILVNNAGIDAPKMVYNMPDEEWDRVIKAHLYGHFYTTRSACVLFRQQGSGRIINTSSVVALGVRGNFGQANYGSAKMGVIGLTKRVAWDMGRYGVTCNVILPGAGTRLNLYNPEVRKTRPKEALERLERLKPEDIGPLVVWLASDDAANVNGCAFSISTGKVALFSDIVEEKTMVKVGGFTVDELFNAMPTTLAAGLVNLAPPQPPKQE